MDKVVQTALGVVLAIALSGALFIGANKLFDIAPRRWPWFTTLIGALAGLGAFGMLWGNRLIIDPVLYTAVATVVGGATGFLLGLVRQRWGRIAVGAGGGLALGLIAGFASQNVFGVLPDGTPVILPMRPALQAVPLVVWTALGVGLGVLVWLLRGRRTMVWRPVAFFGSLGWLAGAFLVPDLTSGPQSEAVLAAGVLGLGAGTWVGLTDLPDSNKRDQIQNSARSVIFLAPALTFIAATLVIPTVRTIFLSLHDRRGEKFVGLENFGDVLTDPNTIDLRDWTEIFTSRLFWVGIVLLVVALIAARLMARQVGGKLEVTPGTIIMAAAAGLFLTFAAFSALRGTIINNLWWVVTVTVVASALGLAIAVLADRASFESVAKSFIFMPMAISFVGAGIIWRFMFIARPPQNPQTGLLNAMWVGLGKLSHSTTPRLIVIAGLLLVVAFLLFLAYRGYAADARGVMVGSLLVVLFIAWFIYALLVGVGGITEVNGEMVAQTILFVQESPFNNVWLMVVLIWIQTGFTMVIFSAAIKAVPAELIEASKVDGATESQTFWRVTIPQIAPTIGVVVTTLVVLVMKVFDIVKVMTNGNFDTQVIANEMWQRAFTELNFGLGSALAVLLFVAVLPVFYINVRRMQEAT